ncbi:MAG: hypothetical protein ABSA83_12925 [Verrucomicrobiota bacterium]
MMEKKDCDYDDENYSDAGHARAFCRARIFISAAGCGMRPDDLLLAGQIRKQINRRLLINSVD